MYTYIYIYTSVNVLYINIYMAQADPDLDPVWGLLMDAAGSDHDGKNK